MEGLLGFMFPRRSKNYLAFTEYMKEGNEEAAKSFMRSLNDEDMYKLIEEVLAANIDKYEQEFMARIRKDVEDKSFPVGFTDN
jgi:hypothetical protein